MKLSRNETVPPAVLFHAGYPLARHKKKAERLLRTPIVCPRPSSLSRMLCSLLFTRADSALPDLSQRMRLPLFYCCIQVRIWVWLAFTYTLSDPMNDDRLGVYDAPAYWGSMGTSSSQHYLFLLHNVKKKSK